MASDAPDLHKEPVNRPTNQLARSLLDVSICLTRVFRAQPRFIAAWNPLAFLFSTFQWLSCLLKVILGRCPKSFSGQSRVLRPTGGTTPPPCWDTQNNVGWVLWHLWTVAKQILFWSWANISHISMFLLKTRLSQYNCKHNSSLGIYEGYYNHPDSPASNFVKD